MCIDAKTSWTAFIVGTLFNIYNVWYYKNPTVTAISMVWEFVLLMQFFEGIAWLDQPTSDDVKGECNNLNKFAAKGAFIANIMQPIIVFLSLFTIASSEVDISYKILSVVIIALYIAWLLYNSNKIGEVECLKPDGCGKTLNYWWWSKMTGSALPYIVSLVSLIFLLARPRKFAMMQLAYIAFTFFLSMMLYSKNLGSYWCLASVGATMLTGWMWENRF